MNYIKSSLLIIFCFYSVSCSMLQIANTGQNPAISKRNSFVNEAFKYLGSPYKHGGVSKSGFDCSGLVYRAALDSLNIKLPRSVKEMTKEVQRIPDSSIRPGDLLFFVTVGNRISHTAIYIGNGKFIHSASAGSKTGVIISSLSEKYWKKCYAFAGRIL